MQAQSFQRYFVWGALAAVFVLILIQWDKDYGSQQKAAIEHSSSNNKQLINKQGLDVNNAVEQDDLPQIKTENVSDQEIENITPEKRKITLTSRTLKIDIDLKGGDIVHIDLLKHAPDIKQKEQPLVLLEENLARVYVAQSGLIGINGPDSQQKGRPLYQSDKENYDLQDGQKTLHVELKHQQDNGTEIKKIFTIERDSYLVKVEYQIQNNTNENWSTNLFAQIKRDKSIDPYADTSLFAMKPFLGFAYWSEDSKYNKLGLFDLEEEPVKLTHKGGWAAFVQHYFVGAWIAPENTQNTYTSRVNTKQENIFGFTTEPIIIQPGETKPIQFEFYAGPKDQKSMAKISEGLDLTVDYGWLWMIAQLIFSVMVFIQTYVGNWGWTIVALTCLVKLLFFPLNQYAFKSMANMRKLQPKMQRLKDMYGDDRQKLSQATMEMYRKEKINPLGSCLPMLIQMPVFIALYWVLSESVEIRHAEFIGWIEDLSIKDPYYVLPGLMALSMWFQQKLSPMVFQDPMQERVMKMMPFMFALFFLFFPAGLVLYWLVNNILTIAQQWLINRKLDV